MAGNRFQTLQFCCLESFISLLGTIKIQGEFRISQLESRIYRQLICLMESLCKSLLSFLIFSKLILPVRRKSKVSMYSI